ncbi:MAG: hypothetical protein IJ313_10580 [Clostridia bacterium]|nr:hypothetical protein [Clostridia bacterium]
MLRAINLNTTHRTPARLAHRARPAEGKCGQGVKTPGNARPSCDTLRPQGKAETPAFDLEAEKKLAYIDFINRLMHRMKMDGIERMLDTALEQEIN